MAESKRGNFSRTPEGNPFAGTPGEQVFRDAPLVVGQPETQAIPAIPEGVKFRPAGVQVPLPPPDYFQDGEDYVITFPTAEIIAMYSAERTQQMLAHEELQEFPGINPKENRHRYCFTYPEIISGTLPGIPQVVDIQDYNPGNGDAQPPLATLYPIRGRLPVFLVKKWTDVQSLVGRRMVMKMNSRLPIETKDRINTFLKGGSKKKRKTKRRKSRRFR